MVVEPPCRPAGAGVVEVVSGVSAGLGSGSWSVMAASPSSLPLRRTLVDRRPWLDGGPTTSRGGSRARGGAAHPTPAGCSAQPLAVGGDVEEAAPGVGV